MRMLIGDKRVLSVKLKIRDSADLAGLSQLLPTLKVSTSYSMVEKWNYTLNNN